MFTNDYNFDGRIASIRHNTEGKDQKPVAYITVIQNKRVPNPQGGWKTNPDGSYKQTRTAADFKAQGKVLSQLVSKLAVGPTVYRFVGSIEQSSYQDANEKLCKTTTIHLKDVLLSLWNNDNEQE